MQNGATICCMKLIRIAPLLLLLLAPNTGLALLLPQPLATDARIHAVMYSPNDVVKFTGHYTFQSAIEFEQGEEVATISVGDSYAWTINPSGNRIFLKPIEPDAVTNMTVLTNRRTYLFELHAEEPESINDPNLVFVLRFMYPATGTGFSTGLAGASPESDRVPDPFESDTPELYNFEYLLTGSEMISPIKVFDDGAFTYFQFRNRNAEVPAFYKVDANGEEQLINYRTRDDYIIVEQVAKNYTLRKGGQVVCIFNEGPYMELPNPSLQPTPQMMDRLRRESERNLREQGYYQ